MWSIEVFLCYIDTAPKCVSFVKDGSGLCVIDTASKCVSTMNFESVLRWVLFSSSYLAKLWALFSNSKWKGNEKLNWICWGWECVGLKGVVGSFITHLAEMLILYPFGAVIFCLEITVLGYRWRIVLIVVDNASWLGNLKLIDWVCYWI